MVVENRLVVEKIMFVEKSLVVEKWNVMYIYSSISYNNTRVDL